MPIENKRVGLKRILLISFLIIAAGFLLNITRIQAAELTTLSDKLTRAKIGVASDHDISFVTPTGVSSGTITLDFNTAGFDAATQTVAFGDIDLQYGSSQSEVNGSCSSSCTKATLAATKSTGGTWGAAFATNLLTFDYPTSGGVAIGAGNYVRVIIGKAATYGGAGVNQIINPGTSGSKVIAIQAGSDVGSVAVAIVTDDQVVITGAVDPSITFSVSPNAAGFGTISVSGITTSPDDVSLGVSTNADRGYVVYVKDLGDGSGSPGLYNNSGGINYLIASATATLSGTHEGYGIQATMDSGGDCATESDCIYSPYTATGDDVGGLSTSLTPLAHFDTNQTHAHTVTIVHKAAAAGFTAAGAYKDTITYVASGQF